MRELAIMQPYLFPYIGYFHLMHAVDRFVVLDDVAWINRGWINRNRIAAPAGVHTFTLPVHGASQNRRINEIERADDERWRARFRRNLRESYAKAPYVHRTMELVNSVLEHEERGLAPWLVHSLQILCSILKLPVSIQTTSGTYGNTALDRTERILDICRRESADTYVNLSGGRALYRREDFDAAGLVLRFTTSWFPPYAQTTAEFTPAMSILDVLMFCDGDELAAQLAAYELDHAR